MNLTRKLFSISIPNLTIQGSGLVILFATVHTVSDGVTNMLSALLPTLQSLFALTETTLAMLIAALSLSALMTQPLFGALADRFGHRRIAALGVIFNAILFSLIGVVPDVYVLFGLILIGGLGSAAFHPAMASMARNAGKGKPELAVGLFSAGGTLGIAIGPIVIMLLLTYFGLSFTPWLMIPGILLGILMFILAPGDQRSTGKVSEKFFDLSLFTGPVGLLALTGILINLAFVTFMSAMPLWLVNDHNLPSDSTLIGWTLSAFSLSAALGGIAGGILSNRVGMKQLIITSTLLSLAPLYLIFSLQPGSLLYFVSVILAGALVNAGMPLLIVSAQDMSPGNKATASGMMMGFSAGAAGLIYVGIGWLQELIGLMPAMKFAYLALIGAAALVTYTLTFRKHIDETPVDYLTCVCSPLIDRNLSVYPQRIGTD